MLDTQQKCTIKWITHSHGMWASHTVECEVCVELTPHVSVLFTLLYIFVVNVVLMKIGGKIYIA